jgi:hypothetical protein
MAHDHHDHDPHTAPLTETQLRVRALESLLTEQGLVDPKALDELIDTYETKVGPRCQQRDHERRRPARDRIDEREIADLGEP